MSGFFADFVFVGRGERDAERTWRITVLFAAVLEDWRLDLVCVVFGNNWNFDYLGYDLAVFVGQGRRRQRRQDVLHDGADQL